MRCWRISRFTGFEHFPLTARFSTKYFQLLPGCKSDSLLPDVTVEPTLADRLHSADRAVDYILAQ